MRLICQVILLFWLLASCHTELRRDNAPADLIPSDTMTLVLHEIVEAESYYQSEYHQATRYRDALDTNVSFILHKYNLDTSRFSQSMTYYAENQNELKGIYEEVLDKVNVRLEKNR